MRRGKRFVVVGCSGCEGLWVSADLHTRDSATCPSCGTQHQTSTLKELGHAETEDGAREIRARLLADRAGHLGEYRASGTYDQQEREVEDYFARTTEAFGNDLDLHPIGTDRFESLVDDIPVKRDRFSTLVSDHPLERDRFRTLADAHFDARFDFSTWSERRGPDIERPEPPENAGISVLQPGQQPVSDVVSGVGPRYSEWLPELLEALLPAAAGTVDRLARAEDETPTSLLGPDTTSADVGDGERPPLTGFEERWGVCGAGGRWMPSLVTWMERWWTTEVDDSERPAYEKTMQVLTGVGTGQSPEDMDLDAMERTFVQLLAHAADAPTVRVVLDGPAWVDLDDGRTGERALDVLATLADVVDLRLQISPRLEDELRRRFPEFVDAHLSETRDESRRAPRDGADTSEYQTLSEWGAQTGRVRLLAWLPADDKRTVKAAKDAATADVLPFSPNSVDAFVGDLAAAGFVEVDHRTTESNVLSLTDEGRRAQALITDNFRIEHPKQVSLESESYCPPSNLVKESVTRRSGTEGGDPDLTAEEWLADTGRAEDAPSPVRWMDADGCRLDAWTLHRRMKAGKRVDGVTAVDEDVTEFDDGRVVYLSAFEDDLQVVTQWGNAGQTLVRVAKALSSRLVWDRVLDEDTVGRDLDNILGIGGLSKGDLADALQRGLQLPIKKENLDYESLRSKLLYKGGVLLGQMGVFNEEDDFAKSEVMLDAHGLITCMTTLLHHVGVDVTIHVCVPNVRMLKADENRLQGFLDWFRHTVPKQTSYGMHSAWRHVGETREGKLKFRLPVDVDVEAPSAEMTASFVVSGRGADDLVGPLASTLEDIDVREAVATGAEETMNLSIPVADGSSFHHIKDVVKEIAEWKGYLPRESTLRRTTRVIMGVLGQSPWSASPFATAEALLGLAKADHHEFGVHHLQHALSTLPADRLFPAAKPSVRTMVKMLLSADGPVSPKNLKAATSTASYERNTSDLEAIALVERGVDGGHDWTISLEPWWARSSTTDRPVDVREADGDGGLRQRSHADEMLYEFAVAMDGEMHLDPVWYGGDGGVRGVDKIAERLPKLAPWVPWVVALVEDLPDKREADTEPTVVLGRTLAAADTAQTALV
ncbi:DUF5817 domain-containing protein (plasmid) [Haloferax sp. S1W]|uniref:DUF5817 domain-containing protein n=1 Tax=Haloferax sp. S1W TaxID=3377110 RepID=UPI0037C594AE